MQIRSRTLSSVILACAALASASCDRSGSIDPATNQADLIPESGKLLGTWQVSRINDKNIAVMPPISLNLKEAELEAISGCITWVWEIERSSSTVLVNNMVPIPVCERGRTPEELAFLNIMKAGPKIMNKDGDLFIVGEEGSISAAHDTDER